MTLQLTLEEMAGLFLPVVFLVLFGIGGGTGDRVRASHLVTLLLGYARPAAYILKLCVCISLYFFLDKFILSSLQTVPILSLDLFVLRQDLTL